jgi:hypothetical protein
MGWFDLARDREKWRRVLVNMVVNFRVAKKFWGILE